MARADVAVRATARRWYDDAFPGWIEVCVVDAAGREHLLRDKAPVLTALPVTSGTAFPFELRLRAEARRTSDDGVEVALLDGLATVDGLRELVVAAADVIRL